MAAIIAGLVALFSASGQTPAVEPRAQRIELFDGKSLAGWTCVSAGANRPATASWGVTNGVIFCDGKPNGYARTLKTYQNYRLHVEWRWPAGPGNSGVFLHLHPPDQVWPLCFEAQLLAGSAGELRLNGGSRLTGTAPHTQAVPRRQPSSEKPVGEWNACDIVCQDNRIAIRVNGVLQNDVAGASVQSGCIGLQAEGSPVEFRNLWLAPVNGEF